jgi:hypothetical protein
MRHHNTLSRVRELTDSGDVTCQVIIIIIIIIVVVVVVAVDIIILIILIRSVYASPSHSR